MSKFTKKNKEHLDSMVIGQGHTIMAGYIPEAVGAKAFSENYYKWKNPTPDSIAQFGFWGGDIDYNTYYPNLDKSELTPKDEEFIEPMFRLLSETIVSKNWNPTDFGQNGVLKASMKMLLGQTVNCDHETTLKASIISLIQLIGGITVYRSDSLRKGRATTKQQTDYGGNYFFHHPLPRKQRPLFGNRGELWRVENGLW